MLLNNHSQIAKWCQLCNPVLYGYHWLWKLSLFFHSFGPIIFPSSPTQVAIKFSRIVMIYARPLNPNFWSNDTQRNRTAQSVKNEIQTKCTQWTSLWRNIFVLGELKKSRSFSVLFAFFSQYIIGCKDASFFRERKTRQKHIFSRGSIKKMIKYNPWRTNIKRLILALILYA